MANHAGLGQRHHPLPPTMPGPAEGSLKQKEEGPVPPVSGVQRHCQAPAVSFSSVQFSRSVVSDSLRPHGLQHARPPCPLSPCPPWQAFNPKGTDVHVALPSWLFVIISADIYSLSFCVRHYTQEFT